MLFQLAIGMHRELDGFLAHGVDFLRQVGVAQALLELQQAAPAPFQVALLLSQVSHLSQALDFLLGRVLPLVRFTLESHSLERHLHQAPGNPFAQTSVDVVLSVSDLFLDLLDILIQDHTRIEIDLRVHVISSIYMQAITKKHSPSGAHQGKSVPDR